MKVIEGRLRTSKNRRYTNPYELARGIDQYFESCMKSQTSKSVSEHKSMSYYEKPPTIPGLCLHLGFATKAALVNRLRDENSMIREVVSSAFLWIEDFYVTQTLQPDAPKSYEFLLKSMGYREPSEPMSLEASMNLGSVSRGLSSNGKPSGDDDKVTFSVRLITSKNSRSDAEVLQDLLQDAGESREIQDAIRRQLGAGEMRNVTALPIEVSDA